MNDFILPLKRYAQFSGRSRRREYWLYGLFVFVMVFLLSILDAVLGLGGAVQSTAGRTGDLGFQASFNTQGGILTGLFALATLIPNIAVNVRRLHDTDRSAWWLLIVLVPLVGAIVWLVFMCLDGTRGANRFGPDPKEGL